MTMESPGDKIAPRLRISGALISLGLLIEVFTLSWNNPVAFLVFLGVGGLLLAVGIVFYLLSLVSPSRS
jgi:predicted membrane channel-forming protein YqfA (hemolysin III family)